MVKSTDHILKRVFSFLILISLLGGGIVFIMFLMAIIIGGDRGSMMAVNAANGVMPLFIKIAALAIITGLLHLYLTRSHSLSLQDGKSE